MPVICWHRFYSCSVIEGGEWLDEWDYESNDGLSPEMFTFSSHKRINWKCSNGHKWSAVIKERTKYKGNMCPECKKEKSERD